MTKEIHNPRRIRAVCLILALSVTLGHYPDHAQTPSTSVNRQTHRYTSLRMALPAVQPLIWTVSQWVRFPSCFWRDLSRVAIQWLALSVLLLTVLGPLVDYDYAQYGVHHKHIYLGPASASHDHFGPGHADSHAGASSVKIDEDSSGVISIPTANEAILQTNRGPVLLLGPLLAVSYPLLGVVLRSLAPQLLRAHEFFPQPPEKPPRATHRTAIW